MTTLEVWFFYALMGTVVGFSVAYIFGLVKVLKTKLANGAISRLWYTLAGVVLICIAGLSAGMLPAFLWRSHIDMQLLTGITAYGLIVISLLIVAIRSSK